MSNIRYKYSSLKEMDTNDDYNFYGVIYDASFPQPDENENAFTCTIKVIDPEINCLTYPHSLNDNLVHLIIKSSNKENLPFVHSVGDIIRVHRGIFRRKKLKNAYLNLTNISKIKSSWCIFPGASDLTARTYDPVACSSSNYTFEQHDKEKIDYLRTWVGVHFREKNSLFYGRETKLANRNNANAGDNDMLVQIVHKTELDDKIVYFVQDETDGCELHAFKYFKFFDVNDVVRVRSFKVFDKNVMIMNKFSNILKAPPFSDLFKDFMNKIAIKMKAIEKSEDVPMFEERQKEEVMKNVVESPTQFLVKPKEVGKFEVKRVSDLSTSDEYFALELNILEIYPANIHEFVCIMCQNCQSSFFTSAIEDLNAPENFNCKVCKSVQKCKLYFNVTLVCREHAYSNKLIKLHLSTFDDEGANFFGMPPLDFFRNPQETERLKDFSKWLIEKENFVHVYVQAIATGNGENDRIYRIVGDYQITN